MLSSFGIWTELCVCNLCQSVGFLGSCFPVGRQPDRALSAPNSIPGLRCEVRPSLRNWGRAQPSDKLVCPRQERELQLRMEALFRATWRFQLADSNREQCLLYYQDPRAAGQKHLCSFSSQLYLLQADGCCIAFPFCYSTGIAWTPAL